MSRVEVRPEPVRRYRYSKWRWRILVRLIDAVGTVGVALWRLVRAVPRVSDPSRILLVQIDHLGDAILTTPMLGPLRAAFPNARIDVLASPSNRAVFEADPRIDRVLVAGRTWFEREPSRRALVLAWIQIVTQIRQVRYELGIDVRGDIVTVLALACAGVSRRVGWSMGGGGFLLSDRAPWIPGRHEVESRLALLNVLGIAIDHEPRVTLGITDADRIRVFRRLRHQHVLQAPSESRHESDIELKRARNRSYSRASSGPAPTPQAIATITPRVRVRPNRRPSSNTSEGLIDADLLHGGRFGLESPLLVTHLGAGTKAKRWPLRSWRGLIARFLEDGWRIIVVGGPNDRQLGAALPASEQLVDWTGQLTITELGALLERADLFIGADSGPAHVAACAGIPAVVLFSGTNRIAQWRPRSRRCLVLSHDVPCRPCHRKVCPLADHPCLTGLTVGSVFSKARDWWVRSLIPSDHRLLDPA